MQNFFAFAEGRTETCSKKGTLMAPFFVSCSRLEN
jgi:hypothetical protein